MSKPIINDPTPVLGSYLNYNDCKHVFDMTEHEFSFDEVFFDSRTYRCKFCKMLVQVGVEVEKKD